MAPCRSQSRTLPASRGDELGEEDVVECARDPEPGEAVEPGSLDRGTAARELLQEAGAEGELGEEHRQSPVRCQAPDMSARAPSGCQTSDVSSGDMSRCQAPRHVRFRLLRRNGAALSLSQAPDMSSRATSGCQAPRHVRFGRGRTAVRHCRRHVQADGSRTATSGTRYLTWLAETCPDRLNPAVCG